MDKEHATLLGMVTTLQTALVTLVKLLPDQHRYTFASAMEVIVLQGERSEHPDSNYVDGIVETAKALARSAKPLAPLN